MIKINQILVLLIATLLLSTSFQSNSVADEIEANDTNVTSIIVFAEQSLALIEDPFEWSTSAVELAIAKNAAGYGDGAWYLYGEAIKRAYTIEDNAKNETAMADIALSLSKVKANDKAIGYIDVISLFVERVDTAEKKQDINGKLATALAVHGDANIALSNALNLPEGNPTLDSYKARTLREVANQMAKKDEFEAAISALDHITMGLTYYRSMAHSDIAAAAINKGRNDLVPSLLENATVIARAQDNGYFIAGALRDIGFAFAKNGNLKLANDYFNEAMTGSRNANSFQEKARSMSRIATRMADAGVLSNTGAIINEAINFAKLEESELFQNFSYYEIAGSAAFCGEFDVARSLITDIPDIAFSSTASLKNSTIRDLAWGFAKHNDFASAVELANTISTNREKVIALSRIIRIMVDPNMSAVARYL